MTYNQLSTDDLLGLRVKADVARIFAQREMDRIDTVLKDRYRYTGGIREDHPDAGVTLIYSPDQTAKRLDTRRLKEECPEIYERYVVETTVSEKVQVQPYVKQG